MNESEVPGLESGKRDDEHAHVHGADCDHDRGPHRALQEPIQRLGEKIGRNDPCSCGSGKKFKKCCG